MTGKTIISIERAVNTVIQNYKKAKDLKFVRKPISYALYQTWKHYDAIEKERQTKKT